MATQTVILPFADAPTNVAGANTDWTNPGNAQLSDNAYAVVSWPGASGTSDPLQCLNLDMTDFPLYALPTRADVKLVGIKDGAVATREYIGNMSLRYNGATYGTADTTVNGDAVQLSLTESDHVYTGGFGSPALTRAIIDSPTFGCRAVAKGKAATTSSDSLMLDQMVMPIVYDDRTPEGAAARAIVGGIEVTWNRGFLSNTVFDFRTGLMPGADSVGSAYLYKGFIEYEVQISDTGAFAGEEKTHYVPSVSTARSEDDLYVENGGPGDPKNLAFIRMLQSGTRYARMRLVVRDPSTKAILQASPRCAAVSATYTASNDPEYINRAFTPDSSEFNVRNPPRSVFWELQGGSLSSGASEAAYLGININTFNTDDSVPKYFRGVRDGVRASLLAEYPGLYAFAARAPWGVFKVQVDAGGADEFFCYQGGTKTAATNSTEFNANGLGSSPAMFPPFWTLQHIADNISDPTEVARLTSTCEDFETYRDGEAELYFIYYTLFGCAHTILDNTQGEPSDEDVLASWCVPLILDSGGVICLDVFFTALPYNQYREDGHENPELRFLRACENLGVFVFGERLGNTENYTAWSPYIHPEKHGSVDSFDLVFDDVTPGTGYSFVRAATDPETRLDLRDFIKSSETDICDLGHPRLARLNSDTCTYVGGGADNAEKMERAAIVARDLVATWPGKAIVTFEPHTANDDMPAESLAVLNQAFILFSGSFHGSNASSLSLRKQAELMVSRRRSRRRIKRWRGRR